MTAAESWARSLAAIIERTALGPAPRPGGRCQCCGSLVGGENQRCGMTLDLWEADLTHEEAYARARAEHRKATDAH